MIDAIETYIDWLEVEPNVDLIIPVIKEDIAANKLSKDEIDQLRSRVVFIKEHGHAEYLKNDPVKVLQQVIPEARVMGGCQGRVK